MSDIYNLVRDVSRMGSIPPEYYEKMIHYYPKVGVKDRAQYILAHARDKRLVDVGCTGPLATALQKVALEYYGLDHAENPGWKTGPSVNYLQIDLDKAAHLPSIKNVNLIIAGEVIEHLSNAGHFLELMREYNAPMILTTPNAYSMGAATAVRKGYESVNKDHVCWYSYYTLSNLLQRHHWTIIQWFWYNGVPGTAEGLIFYVEPNNGTWKERTIT